MRNSLGKHETLLIGAVSGGDLQRHGLGHRMRPVIYTQFAQDFLNVVFDGKWADAEHNSDFIVAFTHLDITQDFRLPLRNESTNFPFHDTLIKVPFT